MHAALSECYWVLMRAGLAARREEIARSVLAEELVELRWRAGSPPPESVVLVPRQGARERSELFLDIQVSMGGKVEIYRPDGRIAETIARPEGRRTSRTLWLEAFEAGKEDAPPAEFRNFRRKWGLRVRRADLQQFHAFVQVHHALFVDSLTAKELTGLKAELEDRGAWRGVGGVY